MRRRIGSIVVFFLVCVGAWFYWQRDHDVESGSARVGSGVASNSDVSADRVPPNTAVPGDAIGDKGDAGPASASATLPPSVHPSQTNRTSIEASMLNARGMRGDVASALLRHEDFADVLRQLRNEGAGSALAADNSRRYGQQTAEALSKRFPDLVIDDFACADSVCGLQASSRRGSDDRVFQTILNSGSAEAPFFSVATDAIPTRDGGVHYRMLFTTDPGRNAIAVPLSPSPAR
jgi:hypothetical protein